jgi:predicted RecA/RadA family phage recombinase
MATTQFANGEVINYTNSGTVTKTSGSAVAIGSLVGILLTDIAASAVGAVAVRGVFKVTAKSGAWTQGLKVYLASDGEFTSASTGNTLAGVAWAAKTTAATTGYVLLNVAT